MDQLLSPTPIINVLTALSREPHFAALYREPLFRVT